MLKKSKRTQYPLKMEPSLMTQIKNQAETERRSVNAFILNVIEQYLLSIPK